MPFPAPTPDDPTRDLGGASGATALDGDQLVQDGLGALRAEIGETGSHEIGSYELPQDQASLAPQLHATTDSRAGLGTQAGLAFNGQDMVAVGDGQSDEDVRAALAGLYGPEFPLLRAQPQDADWVSWSQQLWTSYGPGMTSLLHLVERNRLFYKGVQWVSSVGFGPWREPAKPRDVARPVHNLIKPALDMRTQLLAEQLPGFNCTPASGDQEAMKRAEADQVALEYSWHEQDMARIAKQAGHHVGTDGSSFLELYWDPDAGPWYTVPPVVPPEMAGYPLGKKPGDRFPMGDVRTKVRRIEQVRVSPEATATTKPMIWVVREEVAKSEAITEHGPGVARETGYTTTDDEMQHITAARHGYVLPQVNELLRDHEHVIRITVYCDKSEFLPHGLMMVSVGGSLVVPPQPLPYGVVPMVRWTDGSADPSFYPMPVMEDWVDAQMRINAVKGKWIEMIRKGANTNFLAREGVIAGESMVGGTLNVFAVKGSVPLDDVIRPVGPFDLSPGAERFLAAEIQQFEQLTGYNDATRGSFTADQSGRAILAIREQVERVFAPFINAASEAMCDWAEITLHIMKTNYDLPRLVAVEGNSRPDLARLLTSDDLDTAAQVWVDPENLMPMPRSLRLAILDDLLQKGEITQQEYRRRMPFAMVKGLDSPDMDQMARANRVADEIRRVGSDQRFPILWMDDEAIHQDVLQRQIILLDDPPAGITPPAWQQVKMVAYERWMRLGAQAVMKQQGMALPPGEPMPQGPPHPPQQAQGGLPGQTTNTGMQGPARFLGPGQAPVGPNSPIANTPMMQSGLPDALQAAARFEGTQPQ